MLDGRDKKQMWRWLINRYENMDQCNGYHNLKKTKKKKKNLLMKKSLSSLSSMSWGRFPTNSWWLSGYLTTLLLSISLDSSPLPKQHTRFHLLWLCRDQQHQPFLYPLTALLPKQKLYPINNGNTYLPLFTKLKCGFPVWESEDKTPSNDIRKNIQRKSSKVVLKKV